MSPIITLAKKELRDLFSTPIAYVFITVFLFLAFWIFFSNVFLFEQASLRTFFGQIPILFIIFIPSITMGKWSEEKRSGTYELLMTLPVSEEKLLIGKWLSSVAFLVITMSLTLPLPITISTLGDLDTGPVIGSYFGVILLGISYISFGLLVSTWTRNQIVAFLISVLTLFFFYIIAAPIVTDYLPKALIPIVQYLSFSNHFESMARGVIDSRDVIFFFSTTGLFLYLNHVSLQARKWN